MNVELLKSIATATAAGVVVYIGPADGKPLADAGFIEVNFDDKQIEGDVTKFAAKITDAGAKYLASPAPAATSAKQGSFAVMNTGIVLPKIKRGGGGNKGTGSKYPFDTLEVGQFFFVANSEVDKGDAVKTMSSAVGAANQRYMEPVFENGVKKTKQVTRAKRGEGNKAVIVDGQKVMETVTVDVKKSLRHFTCRPVQAGVEYGPWKAPADGAVIVREEVKAD